VPEGTIAGNRPAALPAPMSELDTPLSAGTGPSGSGVSAGALADGVAGAGVAAVTATVSSAAGGDHVAEVTTLAVAVRVTELTEPAPDATGICACKLTGCVSDTELTVQLAVLSPLAQPLVNVGFWLVGLDESATDTSEAGPSLVETSTTNAASCPRLMLACPRWTLTHSSGPDAVALGLALELALALVFALELAFALGLGLVARESSSDADAVALADDELAADEGAADDEAADPDGEGDPETEDDPDGEGWAEAVALGSPVAEALGSPLGSAAELEALAGSDPDTGGEGDGDGEGKGEGEGDGDGDREGVGEGDGDGVLDDGSSWHVVSVFAEAVVVPGLGEDVAVPGLAEAVACLTEPAWAMPDQAASMLTIRKPPASKLSVIARTCAKRILDCPVWTARHGYRCVLHVFGVN
jgi:hypothetical protein